MKFGLPISLLLHGTVIFAGIMTFGGKPMQPLEDPVIPVEILTVADVNNIRATIKADEPKPADLSAPTTVVEPAPPAPKPEPDPVSEPTPEPEPEPEPEPKPEPDPEPEPEPDPEPEPEPVPEPAPDPVPVAEPEPDKVAEAEAEPAFDLDSLASIVDDARDEQPDVNAMIGDQNNVDQGSQNIAGVGEQTLSAVELEQILRRALACWTLPDGAPDPEDLVVHVGFDIARDGVPGYISLVAPSSHSTSDPYLKVAQSNALRAIEKCGPYDFLPQDRYAAWRTVQVTFAPTRAQIQGYIEP